MTIWRRLINTVQSFIQPRMPRWLATWGLNHVLDKCVATEEWLEHITVEDLYERWTLSKYK